MEFLNPSFLRVSIRFGSGGEIDAIVETHCGSFWKGVFWIRGLGGEERNKKKRKGGT